MLEAQTTPSNFTNVKVVLICIIVMLFILGLMVFLNTSDIVHVSNQVDEVKTTVEMLKCTGDGIKA